MSAREDDLRHRFAFHPGNEVTAPQHAEVRDRCYALALAMIELLPEGRELALMITKIEEAMMWGIAGIARSRRGQDAVHE